MGLELTRFSLPTLNWLRFPDGGPAGTHPLPRWPLERVLDAAVSAGFAAVGLDHFTLGGSRVDDPGPMLRERGLVCSDVGILQVGRDDAPAVAEALALVAAATGARVCIAALVAPLDRADAVQSLVACADVLADSGVRIALEFASYGGLTRLGDAVALCDAVGWERCGLLVDTWHFFRGDADWQRLGTLRGDQIALVHLNDGAAHVGVDAVRAGRYDRLPAGTGCFPLAAFVRALDAAGYAGVYSAEVLSDAIRLRPPSEGAGRLWQQFELTLG